MGDNEMSRPGAVPRPHPIGWFPVSIHSPDDYDFVPYPPPSPILSSSTTASSLDRRYSHGQGGDQSGRGPNSLPPPPNSGPASAPSSLEPCQRSLHVSAIYDGKFYIFGGYQGSSRTNDFWVFNFGDDGRRGWSLIPPVPRSASSSHYSDGGGNPPTVVPTPRDRHTAVVYGHRFYVFGGFDGTSRVNDLYCYDFLEERWRLIVPPVPSAAAAAAASLQQPHRPEALGAMLHDADLADGHPSPARSVAPPPPPPPSSVAAAALCPPPSPRHSHAAVVHGTSMYLFGGYDGSYRNDFHRFDFETNAWQAVVATGRPPRARYRSTCVVYRDSMFCFGGHDGSRHLNDVNDFNFVTGVWTSTRATTGNPPSPRDSHVSVVHGSSMYIFGGSTGVAMNDLFELNLNKLEWRVVPCQGQEGDDAGAAGGDADQRNAYDYDNGARHPPDAPDAGNANANHYNHHLHQQPQQASSWTPPVPQGRALVRAGSMGSPGDGRGGGQQVPSSLDRGSGFSGGAVTPVRAAPGSRRVADGHRARANYTPNYADYPDLLREPPGPRFCHVASVLGNSMFVMGGYDGSHRLNDFLEFRFQDDDEEESGNPRRSRRHWEQIPPSSIIAEMGRYVDNQELSDITFLVEGVVVHAHKLMLVRCSYFRAMLSGGFRESGLGGGRGEEDTRPHIPVSDVRHQIFLALLEYLYTDHVDIQLDIAMELFQAADQFGVERLKILCEHKMLQSITIENAANILHAADLHTAKGLREKALGFILRHFEAVSKTKCFEEMARSNVELVLEILQKR